MASEPSNLKAALWMAGSITSLIIMSIAGRETTSVLNVFQVLEMRSVIGFVMLLPLVHFSGGLAAMRSRHPFLHLGRNLAHYIGQFGWLYALTLIPLAQLISIEFTTPIWTALLAVAFLGERLTRARIMAIVLGLIGIVVIVRPGLNSVQAGHIVVLGAAVFFGISLVVTKLLTRTDNVVRIIFWMLIIQSVIGLLPAIYVWSEPPAGLWPWILLIAFSGTFSHYCMARALVHADATFVSPIDFLRVPLSALVGWILYQERIDSWTVVGAILILAGNMLNLQARPARAAEPVAP